MRDGSGDDCFDFYLHPPARVKEGSDHHHRCCGLRVPKEFLVGSPDIVGICWIDYEHAGSHDVCHGSTERFDRLSCDLPTSQHLGVGTIDEFVSGLWYRCRTGYMDRVVNSHGTREPVGAFVGTDPMVVGSWHGVSVDGGAGGRVDGVI